MAHLLQVIDNPYVASPTVLLDLKTLGFSVDNWDAPGPELRRSVASSSLGDGDLVLAESYADRRIKFDLNYIASSNDLNALGIQKLAHYLAAGEAWLKFQKEGATGPVYFHTKRADIGAFKEFWIGPPGTRVIHLDIPCDPFSYGDKETITSPTITNDPTTGTNKMMCVLPAIKGDVSTELAVSFPTPLGAHRINIASRAALDGTTLTAPYYKSLSAAAKKTTPPSGWTITDTADANMVSGTQRRIATPTSSAIPLVLPTQATVLTWDNLPPGDYRVFIRIGHDGLSNPTEVLFFNRPPLDGVAYTRDEAALIKTWTAEFGVTLAARQWLDMGVASMPGDAPIADDTFNQPGAAGTAVWNVGIYEAPISGSSSVYQFDLDAIVLVPAGRPKTITRHASLSLPVTYQNKVVTLDGISSRWFAEGEPLSAAGTVVPVPINDAAGSLPIAVPNANNVLHFFATTLAAETNRLGDVKSTTTALTIKYIPKYFLDRPAAS